MFHQVSAKTNAKALWQKLEGLFEREAAQKQSFYNSEACRIELKEGRSVSKPLNDFQSSINQLTTIKLVLNDEFQALLLLSSLPGSWETLVVTISNSTVYDKFTFSLVKDNLFNEKARRKESGIEYSQALVNEVRDRSKNKASKGS